MRSKKQDRLGEEGINYQGNVMRIIEYNNTKDIVVEFQDDYKAHVHTAYREFQSGSVKNPYYTEVYHIGMIGNKYNSQTPEYKLWSTVLMRCFDQEFKKREPTYTDVTCCDEWLLFENFYEWLHSQPNFDKWLNNKEWAIDKDILFKGNKIYSPETCCLVPRSVNSLFIKRTRYRGELPIGVIQHYNKFRARCENTLIGKRVHLGLYNTSQEAFDAYKQYKENLIKDVAQIEFDQNNITKQCYHAMMNYIVEITD